MHTRLRELDTEELLEQMPALQQLLHRLMGCQVTLMSKFCIMTSLSLYYHLYYFTLARFLSFLDIVSKNSHMCNFH